MSLEQALADLKAATTTEHLGREHLLDGVAVVCVVRSLRLEEAQALSGSAISGGDFAAGGLLIEGFRMTVEKSLLPNVPVVGGTIDVDGMRYDVKSVLKIGTLVRVTCLRYLS